MQIYMLETEAFLGALAAKKARAAKTARAAKKARVPWVAMVPMGNKNRLQSWKLWKFMFWEHVCHEQAK